MTLDILLPLNESYFFLDKYIRYFKLICSCSLQPAFGSLVLIKKSVNRSSFSLNFWVALSFLFFFFIKVYKTGKMEHSLPPISLLPKDL